MFRKMKNKFLKAYCASGFKPCVTGFCFNYFYRVRVNLYRTISEYSSGINGRVLDVGCGSKPYEELFNFDQYVGLEYSATRNNASSKADIFYDGKAFPLENNSFDSVVCFQVLEHVFEPDNFIMEIARVLKPGGKLMLTVPFVWPLHEEPYDYGRYSYWALKYLLKQHGLEIIIQKRLSGGPGMFLAIFLSHLYYKLSKLPLKLKIMAELLTILPLNFLLRFSLKQFSDNNDLYFDNFIIAQKQKDG